MPVSKKLDHRVTDIDLQWVTKACFYCAIPPVVPGRHFIRWMVGILQGMGLPLTPFLACATTQPTQDITLILE